MQPTSFFAAFLAATVLSAAPVTIRGTVTDPSNAVIANAQVSAVGRVGVLARSSTDALGAFALTFPDESNAQIVVTAPGFSTATVAPEPALSVQLKLAAQVDAVTVAGTAIDTLATEQGSSVTIIPAEQLRMRNEPIASDLLHYVPGLIVAQNGGYGGAQSIFIRGGNYNDSLVQIDGVPVNSFGGAFDFAQMPANAFQEIQIARGPQSAVYGPYANTGVINFITRSPEESPALDVLAEGGSHSERRFGIGSAFRVRGFGVSASAGRMDTDGPVVNSDYRQQYAALKLDRGFGRQSIAFSGMFVEDERGDPGPYGSDPKHTFLGIDRVTRDKNNTSDYSLHYTADVTDRVRAEAFGSFFLNNNGYTSPYGFSYNKDLRGQGEGRAVVSVRRWYTTAVGATFSREQIKNSYITDANFEPFTLDRDYEALYWENRFQTGGRWFWNAGVRAERIHTPVIPGDGFSRPDPFAAKSYFKASPKLSMAWQANPNVRMHASFGTAFRPASGFELAYTDNPALRPERTTSFDAGFEQRAAHNRLSFDETFFYNRFSDLIVSLGGSLSRLSHYQTDNLANSRAYGLEFTARLRTTRWMTVEGWYTWLHSEILSLDGSNLAPLYFRVGQQLLRRPEHSGAIVSTFTWRKLSANVNGVFRGNVLDTEPSLGASQGLYWNPGFASVGINVNYHVGQGVTVYGNLRNALNRRYEEIYGYPSPLLNFVAGIKWRSRL